MLSLMRLMTARHVAALRRPRLRGHAYLRTAPLWLFTGTLLVYSASANGYVDGQDGDLSYRVARSIARNGSFEVSTITGEATPSPAAAPAGRQGKSYAPFGLGAALEMLPPVWLGYALPVSPQLKDTAARALVSFTHALVGAAVVAGTYVAALALGCSALASLGAALSLAIASPWWFYSNSTYTEVTQGAALFFALLFLSAKSAVDPRLRRHLRLGAAALLAFLILVRLVNAVAVGAVGAALVTRTIRSPKPRDWLPAWAVVAALVSALGIIAAYNYVRFGSMLETGYGQHVTAFTLSVLPENVAAYGVDPRRGILVFAPLFVLGAFGYVTMRATPKLQSWRLLALTSAAAVVIPYLLWPYGTRADFYGSRYLVPLYPLLAVGLAVVLDLLRRRGIGILGRWGVATLFAWSLVVALPGVLINPWEYRHLAWEAARMREPPASFPGWQAAWYLVDSKLSNRPEIYEPEHFHLSPGNAIDLSSYEAFQGIDVWSAHAARQLRLPWLRFASWCPALLGLGLLTRVISVHWTRGRRPKSRSPTKENRGEVDLL